MFEKAQIGKFWMYGPCGLLEDSTQPSGLSDKIGDTFIELFYNTDQWKETISVIDGYGYWAWILNYRSDEELRVCFENMNRLGIPLGLEIGGIKKNAASVRELFDENTRMIDRFISLGANIVQIALDEPLVSVVHIDGGRNFDYIGDTGAKFEFAVENTAEYIRMLKEYYPNVAVGDIEVFPAFDTDFDIKWINALEKRLRQKGVPGQDFFRLDVHWTGFEDRGYSSDEGWTEVLKIEKHCRSIGLPFSFIYWAPNAENPEKYRQSLWYEGVMRQAEAYKKAGGCPDQYVVESWIRGIPEKLIPETDEWTYTKSVLDVYNRYVKQ